MKKQILTREVAALRRIGNFDGVDHPLYGPGMFEFQKHYTIQIDTEGWLRATVDFYSQRTVGRRVCCRKSVPRWARPQTPARLLGLAQARRPVFRFDDSAWEAEKMVLRSSLVSRDEFQFLRRLVRMLLTGKTVNCGGVVLSRKLHLNLAAQKPPVQCEYLFEQTSRG